VTRDRSISTLYRIRKQVSAVSSYSQRFVRPVFASAPPLTPSAMSRTSISLSRVRHFYTVIINTAISDDELHFVKLVFFVGSEFHRGRFSKYLTSWYRGFKN
jgi:hypothetical protein